MEYGSHDRVMRRIGKLRISRISHGEVEIGKCIREKSKHAKDKTMTLEAAAGMYDQESEEYNWKLMHEGLEEVNVEDIDVESCRSGSTIRTEVTYHEFGMDGLIFDESNGDEWNKALRLALAGGHSRMADYIACVNKSYNKEGCEYVYAEGQRKWYYWNGTRWVAQKSTMRIRELIRSEAVWQPISSALNTYLTHQTSKKDKKTAQIQRTLERLEDNGYQSAVLTQLEVVLRRAPEEFEDLLDKNRELLPFDNCILDLNTGEVRPGRREDYISGSVGYKYSKEAYPEWERIVSEIFPDEEVREYAQKSFGLALSGDTKDQLVHFLTGRGQNGKSLICTRMADTGVQEV